MNNNANDLKVVVVLGPTAAGKSSMAVRLAKKFNGEVISADSRQIYKGMDIGSGKITEDETLGIKHHLLSVVTPKIDFNVVKFTKLAKIAINDISSRGKIPIICGGTAFYIDSLIKDVTFPSVKANKNMRNVLNKKSVEELYYELHALNPYVSKNIDKKNKRRIIRALEIYYSDFSKQKGNKSIFKRSKIQTTNCKLVAMEEKSFISCKNSAYSYIKLGIDIDKKNLRYNIDKRLKKRLENGLVDEVVRLKGSGLSWKRLENFGLEYKYVSLFLQNNIPGSCYDRYNYSSKKLDKYDNQDLSALYYCLSNKIWQFSKRQMTWWNNDKEINWLKKYNQAAEIVNRHINNSISA